MSVDIRSKDQIFNLPLKQRPPTKACRELLHEYSKITSDKVDEYSLLPATELGTFTHILRLNTSVGVYGTDLREDYFEHGYELFKDDSIIPQYYFIEGDSLAT